MASALAALAGTASTAPPQKKAAVAVAPTRTPTLAPATPASWREVDRLVSEQKFEEASRQVDALLQSAKARRDFTDWTKALIRSVQLRTGLHGYETAVRFLKDEPWPPDLLSRTTLQLFYAQSLVNYAQMYSWEISQRERVESTGQVDLKAWTREQIYDEAARAYVALWKEREALGAEKVAGPFGIRRSRTTTRPGFATRFATRSATSSWPCSRTRRAGARRSRTPSSPSTCRSCCAPTRSRRASVKLDDDASHPVTRLVAVLADLEGWHAGRGEREAALEARLERAASVERRVHGGERPREHLPRPRGASPGDGRPALVRDGRRRSSRSSSSREAGPTACVRAREAAQKGRRAFPESLGGQTLPRDRPADRGARPTS